MGSVSVDYSGVSVVACSGSVHAGLAEGKKSVTLCLCGSSLRSVATEMLQIILSG